MQSSGVQVHPAEFNSGHIVEIQSGRQAKVVLSGGQVKVEIFL